MILKVSKSKWFRRQYYRFITTYQLHQVDNCKIPSDTTNEIRLFAVARNESLRLHYFLSYYFKMGVDRMLIIDNDSTDDSIDICLASDNVHVFSTRSSYDRHWYWMEYLLERYGRGHWCLVVDIDELFFFPYAERSRLPDLIKYLEENYFEAVRCLLLDMYSDLPVVETQYQQNEDPLKICQYFDINYDVEESYFFDFKNWKTFKAVDFRGGMRERVVGRRLPYRLPKISLFKFKARTYLTVGMHAINNAIIADIQGVTFHTKYMFDFIKEQEIEAKREVHYGKAIMYKVFNEVMKENPCLSFFCEQSFRFKDSEQLVNLGIMRVTDLYKNFVDRTKRCRDPEFGLGD